MPDALMEARPGCRLPFSQTGVNGQEVGGVAFDLRSRRPAAVKAQQIFTDMLRTCKSWAC